MTNRYTIVRADEETARAGIPELQLGYALWGPDYGISARGKIFHDGRSLSVRLQAKEKDIRAEYMVPPAPVWEDSCLEFFFMPEAADCYLNYEINPNGCLHLAFGPDRKNREIIVPPDPKEAFRIRTGRTPDGWEAEFRISRDFLRTYYPGFTFTGILRANVYKCGDRTAHSHYLAWNPVETPEPDFHRPEYFGEMVFG